MPLPYPSYDLEVEADCTVRIQFGKFTCWFVMCGDGDKLVAFESDDGAKYILDPEGELPVVAELIKSLPVGRLSNKYSPAEFEAHWNRETDPYLFPKVRGKITKKWPDLVPEIPLPILADWLQEHGLDEAASVLRNHAQQTSDSPT